MSRIVMSVALQAALALVLVVVATRVQLPELRRRKAVPTPPARAQGAKASKLAFVIPADRPRPPLGRFKLTAYSGPQLGQARPITATGTSARAGRTVAVDPAIIPLGSRVYIEGVGERIAEDVGGAVKGRHIDVYLGSLPDAWRFGVRYGTVVLVALPGAA
jgi:3D (Asp-Asp-Asp) domain-containing protein